MKAKSLRTILIIFGFVFSGAILNAQPVSPFYNAVTALNPLVYWPLQDTTAPPTAYWETNYGTLGTEAYAYYGGDAFAGYTNAGQGATGVTGDGDQAVFLNGAAGSYLAVPLTYPGVTLRAGAFTVEVWIYPTNQNSATIIAQTGQFPGAGLEEHPTPAGWSLNQGYVASQNSSPLTGWSFHVYNGQTNASGTGTALGAGGAEASVSDNFALYTWYHLVGVYDGVNAHLYVDGTNASADPSGIQTPMTGTQALDTWDELTIGGGRGLNANLFYGSIDEVAVYTTALSASRILAHYNAVGNPAGPSSYYNTVQADSPCMYWRMDAPPYGAPAFSTFPPAANYGSATTANAYAIYEPGTVPGLPGPAYSGLTNNGSGYVPSYACGINGISSAIYIGGTLVTNNTAIAGVPLLNTNGIPITLMLWYKMNPADSSQNGGNGRYCVILGHSDNSWRLAQYPDGTMDGNCGPGDNRGIDPYNDGNWHFVVATYTNANKTSALYVDGYPEATASTTGSGYGTLFPGYIGDQGNYTAPSNHRFTPGSLCQVAIFTNYMTLGQVQNLTYIAGIPPTILQQPAAQTALGGQPTATTLTVRVSGATNLVYQWYFNGSASYSGAMALANGAQADTSVITNGATLVDTTSASSEILAITNMQTGGYYFVVMTNNFGSITSAIAQLTVVTTPIITAQYPAGPFSMFVGQSLTMSVTASGPPSLTYQWYTNNGSGFVADTTAGTTASYALTGVQTAMSGYQYYCTVGNFGSVNSLTNTLTVLTMPASLTNSIYGSNVLALNPTAYWPMHENEPPLAQRDMETNYGTAGQIANAYYADWQANNGAPGNLEVVHNNGSALASSADPSVLFTAGPGGSYAVIPTTPSSTINPPFTLEAWVKPDNNSFGIILGVGNETSGRGLNGGPNLGGFDWSWANVPNPGGNDAFGITMRSGNGVSAYTNMTVQSFTPGNWYHLVTTFDGTNVIFYVNGSLVSLTTAAINSLYPDNWQPLTIGGGRWAGSINNQFYGGIDELAVYTNVLSANDINNHYLAGATVGSNYFQTVANDHPLLYYRMDSPPYTTPAASTWPVLTNYGAIAVNGVYRPNAAPGSVPGPSSTGLSGEDTALPCDGNSIFADAGSISQYLDPTSGVPFTVAAWVKGNPTDAQDRNFQAIAARGTGNPTWRLTLYGNAGQAGNLNFDVGNGYDSGPVGHNLNDGNWHYAVATYNSAGNSNVITYVDGISCTNAVSLATFGASSGNLYLGGYPTGANGTNFNSSRVIAGDICEEACWYGKALSGSQIAALYNDAEERPYLTTQPVSGAANQNGGFTNSATAFGAQPLYYQWYTNGVAVGSTVANMTGNITNGVNTNILVINPVQKIDAVSYYVVVTNNFGSVTSAVVSLTVFSSPTLVGQFPITQNTVLNTNYMTVYAGANPNFSVGAAGAIPLNYHWFTNGVAVGGATNPSLMLPKVQIGTNTTYCVVTNIPGSVTSSVWSVSVIADPTNSVGGPAPYPQQVLALNPIGYWRLNELDDGQFDGNPGALAYDYASGNDGLYTNVYLGNSDGGTGYNPAEDPSDTSAQFAYYNSPNSDVNFIGTNIDFGVPAGSNGEFTVECWAQLTQNHAGALFAKGWGGGGEEFVLDTGSGSSNDFRFFVRSANGTSYSASSTIIPAFNVWYHLAGVCDEANSNVLLYVNGLRAAFANMPSATNGILSDSVYNMTIGARSSTLANAQAGINDSQFQGYINDVALFNYALSSTQLANEYLNSGLSPYFLQQPTPSTNLDDNATLTVPAVATGTPTLSYKWFDVNASSYIAGQTNATLVISNIQASDSYYLTVANSLGSTNSTTVAVTVISGLNLALQPGNLAVYAGRTVTYSASATGNYPIYYQWLTNSVAVGGAANPTFTLVVPTGNSTVGCTVTNSYNGYSSSNVTVNLTGIAVSGLYQLAVLGNNPVAYWRLNEIPDNGSGNNGTIAYDYVGGHNGAYMNVQLGLPGFNPTDYPDEVAAGFGSFNNVGATADSLVGEQTGSGNGIAPVNFTVPLGSNAEFSAEALVSLVSDSVGGGIVGQGLGSSEQYYIDTGAAANAFRFFIRTGNGQNYNASSTIAPTNNVWYHVVGVCDESNGLIAVYVNGVLAGSTGITPLSGLEPYSSTVSIGSRPNGSGVFAANVQVDGSINDVALYNYALTPAQIAADYQATGLAPVTVNPNPTNIVFSVTGTNLTLSWPADHTGWQLQAQTNTLSKGISTNWVNVSGSTGTNELVIPIHLANGCVFYRLVYP